MRIQLKQNEIESALKGYIAKQGIGVAHKLITMNFTSGRKNNGLSVEIVIEDEHRVNIAPAIAGKDCFAADAGVVPTTDPEEAYVGSPADEKEAAEGKIQAEVPVTTATSLFG